MSNDAYDIAIIGAGMVGAAFAAALSASPLRVALIDGGSRPAPPPRDHFDLRVSAISPGTRSILQAVGAWEYLDQERVGAYETMFVWDASSNGCIEFGAADMGESWLGYIIENANIQHALLRSIDKAVNVHQRFDATPVELEIRDGSCRISLQDGDTLSARLAVGADGAGSWVRNRLGIAVDTRLYGQRAYVCEARTGLPHRQTAWQRFLTTGPVAFLPLANGHCSVVWTCGAELAAELADLDGEAFSRRLEAAFEAKLGSVAIEGPVRSFDLSRRQAAQYVVDRGALIGDAVHVVHPLAGQGANLGFGDAWSLAHVVLEAERQGRDIGQRPALRRYERWRRSENFSMLRMLDVLHGLFSSEFEIVRRMRGLGLNLVDRQDWLKHFLAKQALGAGVPEAYLR